SGSPSSIPSGCNGDCPSHWFNDTVCDMECFSEECGWDGDDCAGRPRINANQQSKSSTVPPPAPAAPTPPAAPLSPPPVRAKDDETGGPPVPASSASQPDHTRQPDGQQTENGTNRLDIPETCFGDCRDLEWVNDSVCDLTCYNYACGFDGGDCEPGLNCTELASYCEWNETCQSQDDGFGRCESLCSTIECSEEENEVCEVQRVPEGEPGAGSGVGKCVCAENYVRGDNDECFQVRDCAVGEWKDWGECSKSCEGGVKKRTREVTAEPQGGGEECPALEETAPCNEQPCPVACVVGDWSIWSPCSKDCGGGKRRRGREITTEPQHDGEECPPLSEEEDCNTEPCKTDCTVSDWSGWDKCSEECGGGTQSRTRTVVEPDQSGGAPCPELSEERACNEDPCAVDCEVGGWGNFSECSKSCGGGTRTRNRTVEVEPSDGGEQCPDLEETEECNTQPCRTDCTVSDWSGWDKCSEQCGGGTQSRTRTVVEPDQSGGAPCPELSEERACNEDPCAVDCKVGGWGNFSECSKSCGGGSRTRNRTVEVEPSDDGEQCPDLEETEECNTQPCASASPSIPSTCSGMCRSQYWYADGMCDPECFTEECGWDGGDCGDMPRINADQQQQQQQPAVGTPRPISAGSDQQQQGPAAGIPDPAPEDPYAAYSATRAAAEATGT
ncbi:unnamed protein product, partial [Vitrella brassicaformis CCMP3155]